VHSNAGPTHLEGYRGPSSDGSFRGAYKSTSAMRARHIWRDIGARARTGASGVPTSLHPRARETYKSCHKRDPTSSRGINHTKMHSQASPTHLEGSRGPNSGSSFRIWKPSNLHPRARRIGVFPQTPRSDWPHRGWTGEAQGMADAASRRGTQHAHCGGHPPAPPQSPLGTLHTGYHGEIGRGGGRGGESAGRGRPPAAPLNTGRLRVRGGGESVLRGPLQKSSLGSNLDGLGPRRGAANHCSEIRCRNQVSDQTSMGWGPAGDESLLRGPLQKSGLGSKLCESGAAGGASQVSDQRASQS
jgi:hypothetical protein